MYDKITLNKFSVNIFLKNKLKKAEQMSDLFI